MKKNSKIKNCVNFKPINDYISHYRTTPTPNCSECIYFSSRNCGFDISDHIENDFDLF